MIRSLLVLSAGTCAAIFAIGCSSTRPSWEPSDPQEQLDLVNTGVSHATGTIEATSVREIYDAYRSDGEAITTILSALGTTNFSGSKCVTKTTNDGTVDLACASDGKAKGTVQWSSSDPITAASSQILLTMSADNACVGSLCFQLELVLQAKSALSGLTTTVVASADRGSVHTFSGRQALISSETTSYTLALFDSGGRSYAFTPAVDGSFIIQGANGPYTCTPNGPKVSCKGATQFDL